MAKPSAMKVGKSLEWCTELPLSLDDFLMSPMFIFQGSEWHLRISNDARNIFSVRLEKLRPEVPFRHVKITTYSKYKTEFGEVSLIVSKRIVTPANNTVWDGYVDLEQIVRDLEFDFLFEDVMELHYMTDSALVHVTPQWREDPGRKALSQDFGKLLDSESNHDVVLKCGDRIFKAHKTVLMCRSKMFETMLRSDMVEGRTGQVDIKGMDPDLFRVLLQYLYTGECPELNEENAKILYAVGDQYAVETLMRLCSGFLSQKLTIENACEYLTLADVHNDTEFKDTVVAYMLEKRIPLMDHPWLAFCNAYPEVAIDALNRYCRMESST